MQTPEQQVIKGLSMKYFSSLYKCFTLSIQKKEKKKEKKKCHTFSIRLLSL